MMNCVEEIAFRCAGILLYTLVEARLYIQAAVTAAAQHLHLKRASVSLSCPRLVLRSHRTVPAPTRLEPCHPQWLEDAGIVL